MIEVEVYILFMCTRDGHSRTEDGIEGSKARYISKIDPSLAPLTII